MRTQLVDSIICVIYDCIAFAFQLFVQWVNRDVVADG